MSNETEADGREFAGAVYLSRARLMMIEDGLSETAALRVVILHALSCIASTLPSGEADLPAWLEAEARAIRLANTEPHSSTLN